MSLSCQLDNETNNPPVVSIDTVAPTFDNTASVLSEQAGPKRLRLPLNKQESSSSSASIDEPDRKKPRLLLDEQEPVSRVYARVKTHLSWDQPCHPLYHEFVLLTLGEDWSMAKFWSYTLQLHPEESGSLYGKNMKKIKAEIEQHGLYLNRSLFVDHDLLDQVSQHFNPAIEHPAALSARLAENTIPYCKVHPASMFSFQQTMFELHGRKRHVYDKTLEGIRVAHGDAIFDWDPVQGKWTQEGTAYTSLLSHLKWKNQSFNHVLEDLAITVKMIGLGDPIIFKQVSIENWQEWESELNGRPVRILTAAILQLLRSGSCAGLTYELQ